MELKIALAGNPNCGKTTLFNALTGSSQYTGNWPGVTVEKKEGRWKGRKDAAIQDLPGIYSLSPYTPEEVAARNCLTAERPHAILNIVDGANLERNLYLTTQLLELDIPVVVAVNMIDLVRKNGDRIDLEALEAALGCPVAEISALKGDGVEALMELTASAAQKGGGQRPPEELSRRLREAAERARTDPEEDPEELEAGARYDYIQAVVEKAVRKKAARRALSPSDQIDRVVTNRVLALPIFALVMFLVYGLSMGSSPVSIGARATDWVNDVLFGQWVPGAVGGFLENIGCADWLTGLIVDGIIAGVGAVLGFVPQMLVLFLLLSILEDVGYMARIAFILDRVFRRFGLSGKSFIPMLVGAGCGVPGVMASRTIENERDRRMTVMTTCFIPCGAKMPIVGMFAGALFGGSALVAASAYFIGVAAIVISGVILKKTRLFAGESAPFVMELPAYHVPGAVGVLRSAWERGWSFIKRAGTVILASSMILWFLQSFGWENGAWGMVEDNSASLLAAIGSAVCWIFRPLGFGTWQAAVAVVTGLIAKENVVSTFEILYPGGLDASIALAYTPLAAYSFLIFNLLCAPCFAAMGAIRREMNSGKWTAAAIGYMCGFAYLVSLIVYQIGGPLLGGGFGAGTVLGLAALAFLLYLLFRRNKYRREGAALRRGAVRRSTV